MLGYESHPGGTALRHFLPSFLFGYGSYIHLAMYMYRCAYCMTLTCNHEHWDVHMSENTLQSVQRLVVHSASLKAPREKRVCLPRTGGDRDGFTRGTDEEEPHRRHPLREMLVAEVQLHLLHSPLH